MRENPALAAVRPVVQPHAIVIRAIQVLTETEKPECVNKSTDQTLVPFLPGREMI